MALHDAPLTTRPATVAAVRPETGDTVTLDVVPADGSLTFAPGQFNMLYVFGVGEAAISISSDPARPGSLSHTVRDVGIVTHALAGATPGMHVGVRGPFGTSWPVDGAEGGDLVIVAGGIGLAPVRPAIEVALAQRERFRRLVLAAGAKTPAELVFRGDLQRWTDDIRIDLHVTVDRGDRTWAGKVGFVTKTLEAVDVDPGATTVLTCGPEVMMRATARAMLHREIPADRIHVSLERNMRCAVGTCGHCQLGPVLVCRDGPVFPWSRVASLLEVRDL